MLHVPAGKFRKALAELPGIGEPIVNAFIMRRQRLQRDHEFAGLRILSSREDRNGRHLHDFLTKNHVPHRFVRIEERRRAGAGAALSSLQSVIICRR